MQQVVSWNPAWRRQAVFALAILSLLAVAPAPMIAHEADATPAQGPDTATTPAPEPTPAEQPVAGDAVRIYRDPETGRLGRVPQDAIQSQAEEMRMMLNESAEGLRVRVLNNGAEAIDLQGRFRSFTVARRTAGGAVATACGDSVEEARAILELQISAPVQEVRNDQ